MYGFPPLSIQTREDRAVPDERLRQAAVGPNHLDSGQNMEGSWDIS